eukprot:SAG31_NODE_10252_length_1164_cov_1.596244_1_plen_315_part_10
MSSEVDSRSGIFVGVLDMFGFEHFEQNGFEQLCINYANEKLQLLFSDHVFKSALDEYKAEGISVDHIEFPDNKAVVDLIEKRGGILSILDEELRVPGGSDAGFAAKVVAAHNSNTACFESPKFGGNNFIVVHFAARVQYTVDGERSFLARDRDSPSDLVTDLLLQSAVPFLKNAAHVLAGVDGELPNMASNTAGAHKRNMTIALSAAGGRQQIRRKRKVNTVAAKFKSQLVDLCKLLSSTGLHYVRCLKPNANMSAIEFNRQMMADQLRSAGVVAAVEISRSGYPSRLSMAEFARLYGPFVSLVTQPGIDNKTTC